MLAHRPATSILLAPTAYASEHQRWWFYAIISVMAAGALAVMMWWAGGGMLPGLTLFLGGRPACYRPWPCWPRRGGGSKPWRGSSCSWTLNGLATYYYHHHLGVL
ncbi:hypothetical protein DFAR_2460010 [Desulfarculales bacterium]